MTIDLSVSVERTPRVMQLEGLFDLAPAQRGPVRVEIDLPLEEQPWQIGLLVGPSGCGKSTIGRALFGEPVGEFEWPAHQSLVDVFPAGTGIGEIAQLLSSVGLSSPPAWLRPYRVLSTGEKFRAHVARALAEAVQCKDPAGEGPTPLVVLDEFTSVLDRTLARVASAAVGRAVRRMELRMVAMSCHQDVVDWLAPDWTYEPHRRRFTWRRLRRRPPVLLELSRCGAGEWEAFRAHHYLSGRLAPSAQCFLASVGLEALERPLAPAVFVAVLPFPHPHRPGWREHRVVCLPEFQGIGLGHAASELVAGLFHATGRPYRSVTSNPAMIRHRARSPWWRMTRPPSLVAPQRRFRRTGAHGRLTASFEYVGPAHAAGARLLGIGRKQ